MIKLFTYKRNSSLNIDQKLGLTIKKIREEKNLSQSELGKISGIERTTIVKLEKGEQVLA